MYEDLTSPSTHNVSIDMAGHQTLGEQNKGITPVFFIAPVQNGAKTEKEGRPIFDEEEHVRIFVAGDQYTQVVHPVSAEIKERFPEQYRAWKERKQAMTVSGTPLRSWPLLAPAQIAEFEALKIFNVEGLADLTESAMGRAPGLRDWKIKAKAWLDTAINGADAARFASENERLRGELDEQKSLVADMAARLEALEAAASKSKRAA